MLASKIRENLSYKPRLSYAGNSIKTTRYKNFCEGPSAKRFLFLVPKLQVFGFEKRFSRFLKIYEKIFTLGRKKI